jgi:hypothetical protein
MGLENVPRCQHVKVNGTQCGSPALRRKHHCYFHERVHREREILAEDQSGRRKFGFPLLEDANSVQVALMKVIQMVGSGVLDHKTAGLMLYGLQTASANLRHAKFEPAKFTDVVIDEDTVDLTRLEGPQWSAGDFKEESTAAQLEPSTPVHNGADRAANQAAKAVTNSLTHKDAPDKNKPVPVVDKEIIEIAKRREQKRNLRAQPAESDEPPSLAKILLDRLTPGWEEEERKEEERKEEARRAGV